MGTFAAFEKTFRERVYSEKKDLLDSTLPHTSGFSIHQGSIVQ